MDAIDKDTASLLFTNPYCCPAKGVSASADVRATRLASGHYWSAMIGRGGEAPTRTHEREARILVSPPLPDLVQIRRSGPAHNFGFGPRPEQDRQRRLASGFADQANLWS